MASSVTNASPFSIKPPGPVLVMGTGAVGGWVGGRLAAAGVSVHFVARPRMQAALSAHGLLVTDCDGGQHHLRPHELQVHGEVPTALAPALTLLTVKSGATAQAAAELGARLPPGSVVLSLQNGVDNTAVAQAAAPHLTLLAGTVPYNIAELAPGHLHRGTGGRLLAQAHPAIAEWVPLFAQATAPIEQMTDMAPIQWGKLLINLNNPVNALSGLPLRQQLLNRDFRRCFAGLMEEGLMTLNKAGIPAAKVTAIPPHALLRVLRLPSPIFRVLAARMLRIDDQARSSMADDFARGRATEIDSICGAIVRLAQTHGIEAPMNRRMVELVRAWPQGDRNPWTGPALWAELLGARPLG